MADRIRAMFVMCCAGLVMMLGTSCASVAVSSNPSNARVFVNGKDTGLLTPAELRVRSLPTGILNVEARLQGYKPESGSLRVARSVGKIIFSIWPPGLIDFGCDGWKSARPGRLMLDLTPLDSVAQKPFNTPAAGIVQAPAQNYMADDFPIKVYHFDSITRKGSVTVDIGDKGFQARLWVVKNIGMICASKNIALESGSESFSGSKYTIFDESIRDGLLTIVFEATY